ncbi:MAG: serine protease [Casimicrobiaceae bacterium]
MRAPVSGYAAALCALVLSTAGSLAFAQGTAPRVPGTPGVPSAAEAAAQVPVPPAAAASTAARQILDRARPAVIQIKGFFGTNTSEAFHGTGFAVAPGGVFMTNWHVVSDAVLYPDKYRLEYRTAAGATGRITVRAIDVRHDLAVVEAVGFAPAPLELAHDTSRGERAYSIGFPLDVGLTITEGVSNGRVEDSFQPRIHYSGALNAGMSGGPGLDAAGRVIGVNVAGYLLSQLVAFFVPAEYAIALLASSAKTPLDARHARDEIARQLREHSEAVLAALATPLVLQAHQGYDLPGKLAAFVECHAAGDPAPDQPVQVERVSCDAKSSLYVASNLNSGGLSFRHQVLRTGTLDAWRFASRLQAAASPPGSGFGFGVGGNRQLAPFACTQDDVLLDGMEANAIVCLRAYRKFDGIYDLRVHVVSKNQAKRGIVSTLWLTGVSATSALAFAKIYLAAIRWKP